MTTVDESESRLLAMLNECNALKESARSMRADGSAPAVQRGEALEAAMVGIVHILKPSSSSDTATSIVERFTKAAADLRLEAFATADGTPHKEVRQFVSAVCDSVLSSAL